ncbi:MAG TPA: hypothetical protein PLX90_01705 [Anaerolineales bacterium]|nr:hypothetical protein [Anaerolineales bacterium]
MKRRKISQAQATLYPHLLLNDNRADADGFSLNAFIMLLIVVIGLPIYLYWAFVGAFQRPKEHEQANEILTAMAFGDVPTGTPESLYVGQIILSTPMTPVPTYTLYPTYTPQATFTPSVDWLQGSPVPTKNSFEPNQVNWVFSYYYPDLVAKRHQDPSMEVNCHPDNWIWNNQQTRVIKCKDTTASGAKWSDHLMYEDKHGFAGGVAVPYYPNTLNPIYPMGSVITVTSPPIMAGDYIVIDICPACDDYINEHGVIFLDFLAKGLPDGVNFWSPVSVLKVRYPNE